MAPTLGIQISSIQEPSLAVNFQHFSNSSKSRVVHICTCVPSNWLTPPKKKNRLEAVWVTILGYGSDISKNAMSKKQHSVTSQKPVILCYVQVGYILPADWQYLWSSRSLTAFATRMAAQAQQHTLLFSIKMSPTQTGWYWQQHLKVAPFGRYMKVSFVSDTVSVCKQSTAHLGENSVALWWKWWSRHEDRGHFWFYSAPTGGGAISLPAPGIMSVSVWPFSTPLLPLYKNTMTVNNIMQAQIGMGGGHGISTTRTIVAKLIYSVQTWFVHTVILSSYSLPFIYRWRFRLRFGPLFFSRTTARSTTRSWMRPGPPLSKRSNTIRVNINFYH